MPNGADGRGRCDGCGKGLPNERRVRRPHAGVQDSQIAGRGPAVDFLDGKVITGGVGHVGLKLQGQAGRSHAYIDSASCGRVLFDQRGDVAQGLGPAEIDDARAMAVGNCDASRRDALAAVEVGQRRVRRKVRCQHGSLDRLGNRSEGLGAGRRWWR